MIVTYRGSISKAIRNEALTIDEIAKVTGIERRKVQTNLLTMCKQPKYTITRIGDRFKLEKINKLERVQIYLGGSHKPRSQ
ncbi:hypothetical protein D0812_21970 [Vibrio owensii]|uniref:Uncharacterized protein n=1 Tax=Vibrio owensii TaxID=696485 RepID=A0AAP9GG58_9VIBR|nr:hypothetical protein [Vibrio owensii]AYO17058.1 hypothetical protein D0812_21970 [Vibrio owensii]QGH49207.1 hypothetical protein APZ19_18995 [Vibrio owensii]